MIRSKSFNIAYLLSKLNNLEVVNMDICKLFNNLKYFKIDFSEKVHDEDIIRIEEILHKSFDDSRKNILKVPTIRKDELKIDCDHSKTYAIMNLNCKDQTGLLAYIIDIFDEMKVDIATAKIHTLKNSVRDMFLIEKNGSFCHNVDKIIEKLTREK